MCRLINAEECTPNGLALDHIDRSPMALGQIADFEQDEHRQMELSLANEGMSTFLLDRETPRLIH
jgi:hypothetical protein